MEPDSFEQRKLKIVADLAAGANDQSPKGSLDPPVIPLVGCLNGHPDYVTTSSCSGRVAAFLSADADRKGGRWAFISHEPADPADLLARLSADLPTHPAGGELCFKFEPFVMHVECRSLLAASRLLQLSLGCGFRESGIMNADRRFMLAVRGSLRLEAPLASGGCWLVPEDYVLRLTELANGKMAQNLARIDRFYKAVSGALQGAGPEEELPSQLGLLVPARATEQLRVALDRRGWLDGTRGIGKQPDGRMGLPVTVAGAAVLVDALESGLADDPLISAILEAGGGQIAAVDSCAVVSQKRRASPYQRLVASCERVLGPISEQERSSLLKEVPSRWETLGDLVLLPADAFASEARWVELAGGAERLWAGVAGALKVKVEISVLLLRRGVQASRLARQAAVDPGRMRQSRVRLLLGSDGWVSTKQHGVVYELDVTKVMFSSGNTTERRCRRLGRPAEPVVQADGPTGLRWADGGGSLLRDRCPATPVGVRVSRVFIDPDPRSLRLRAAACL